MAHVTVEGRKVFYQCPRELGRAAPRGRLVLLVHGAFDDHRLWRHLYPALGESHTPIAIDLPGRGDSDGPAIKNAATYLRFFGSLVDALGLGRFVFFGHSMGGSMAVDFAAQHPERTEALVLMSSAPRWDVRQEDIDLWDNDWDRAHRDNEGFLYSKETPRALREDYERQMRTTPAASCKADIETCRTFALDGLLGRIGAPTLVVCGDEEYWIEGSRALHRGIAGSRLELVPAAGHAIALEQPARLETIASDFLKALR
ncbi:MAG: alpha/beta fold hydrolase [Alphaproteobacteria bacterium]